jgi:hypothetical protein
MSHVAGSRATPKLAAVNLGDEAEELALDPGSLLMRLVDRIDQVDVTVCICRGHRDLVRSRGRRLPTLSNIRSIVKPFALSPSLDLAARERPRRVGPLFRSR